MPTPCVFGADTDAFEAQRRLALPELAFEHAGEEESCESAFVRRSELRVELRLLQCGLQAPLEIVAAGASLDRAVDGDDGGEVVTGEAAERDVHGGGIHLESSGVHAVA